MFHGKQWATHDCQTTSLSSMWEEPSREFEFLEEALHAYFFGGVAWAILGGHEISAQDQKQPHTYHKWRAKPLGWDDSISPCSPNTLHKLGVEGFFDELPRMAHFIWMIAWVWDSLIGDEIPYVYHHSYLEEAIGQQEGFHLHLPLSHDVGHLVLHTWEETWALAV